MKLVNLTPHPITLVLGETTTIESAGVARVATSSVEVGTHMGVPLIRSTYGEVVGLPAPQEGVLYIVSAMVRSALLGRTDLASPAALVRNEAGQITGCKALEIN